MTRWGDAIRSIVRPRIQVPTARKPFDLGVAVLSASFFPLGIYVPLSFSETQPDELNTGSSR